jgi:hypothetical protein
MPPCGSCATSPVSTGRRRSGATSPKCGSGWPRTGGSPRSVFDWTEADAPGEVLLAAARVDCFDLLPEVFAAVEPLLG